MQRRYCRPELLDGPRVCHGDQVCKRLRLVFPALIGFRGRGHFFSQCAWGPPPPRADVSCALRRDLAVAAHPQSPRAAKAGTPPPSLAADPRSLRRRASALGPQALAALSPVGRRTGHIEAAQVYRVLPTASVAREERVSGGGAPRSSRIVRKRRRDHPGRCQLSITGSRICHDRSTASRRLKRVKSPSMASSSNVS